MHFVKEQFENFAPQKNKTNSKCESKEVQLPEIKKK